MLWIFDRRPEAGDTETRTRFEQAQAPSGREVTVLRAWTPPARHGVSVDTSLAAWLEYAPMPSVPSEAPQSASLEPSVDSLPAASEPGARRPRVGAKQWLLLGVGFAVLDVYLNVPNFVRLPPVAWLGFYLAFFPLAHGVGRLTGAGGLGALGLALHRGWGRNLLLGFALSALFWTLKYVALWALGAFHVEGLRPTGDIALLAVQAALAMWLSSATDEVLVRGYLFRQLSGTLSSRVLVALTTVVYVVNHLWYVHLTVESSLFLGLIGCMFALALARTGSLWLGIGLHWGGNVVYRLYDGFDAQGGALRRVVLSEAAWLEAVKLGVTALALAALWLLFRVTVSSKQDGPLSARG